MIFLVDSRAGDEKFPKTIEADSLKSFVRQVVKLGCRFELIPPGGDMEYCSKNETKKYVIYFHNDYDDYD